MVRGNQKSFEILEDYQSHPEQTPIKDFPRLFRPFPVIPGYSRLLPANPSHSRPLPAVPGYCGLYTVAGNGRAWPGMAALPKSVPITLCNCQYLLGSLQSASDWYWGKRPSRNFFPGGLPLPRHPEVL